MGDVEGSPGRSLYVRLHGPESGKGAAGKWTDAATGEHGDLLDLIAANQPLTTLRDTLDEARRFLSLPRPERRDELATPAVRGSPEAARRLWAMSKPVQGTIAETYFRTRAITALRNCTSLRFHPRCWYRPDRDDAPDGRAAMGDLLGHGVRFGRAADTIAAGEGIETMLSLHQVAPNLPAVAALSAAHLAALILPTTCKRLYIVEDADPAGRNGADQLASRAEAAGVEALRLRPALSDLNDDLVRLGTDALTSTLRMQFAPEDVRRILQIGGTATERERAA